MALDFAQEATALVDHFSRGRISEIANCYDFPAVLYIGRDVLVLWDETDLSDYITTYRQIMVEAGLDHVTSEVTEAARTDGHGCTVSVENTFYDQNAKAIGTSAAKYFLKIQRPCSKIRLVEYLDWPFRDALSASAAFNRLKR